MGSIPERLHVGDDVMWRGCWGEDPAKVARVTGIDYTAIPRSKYGRPVNSALWVDVRANHAIVTLDNGHWAYGEQLDPLPSLDNPAIESAVVSGLHRDVCGSDGAK